MKKIIALLVLMPVLAQAKVIDGTKKEVLMDNTVYERVFTNCIKAFSTDKAKQEEAPSSTIEACDKTASKIAAQTEYVSTDDKYYITIKPNVKVEPEPLTTPIPAQK